MPDSCRERIVAAAAARIAAITGVPGLTVARERRSPVTSDELPFVGVFEADAQPREDWSGERAWTLVVSAEGLADGATDTAARTAAANLRAEVEKALYADPTLGGLARDLRAAPEPPPPQLDAEVPDHVADFQAAFEIDFATREDDPFTFA